MTTRGRRKVPPATVATIVVLAKHPEAGRVKTRLAAAIGRDAACRVYEAFVRDLARRLDRHALPVWWAFTPASAPFATLVRSPRVFPQRGRDLGARIHQAVARVAREAGTPVLAIGTDAPHVPLREIERAARALARGVADVVLGPARDGGYYLVGVRRPCRALFEGIPWSTPGVLTTTRRRCRELGLRLVEVAPSFDVDDVGDLRTLARMIARRPREFPASHAVVRRLRLSRRAGSPRPAASPSSDCARR